jgi:large subunit ribosomal protein L2
MAIVKTKPTSPGRRHVVQVKSEGLHKGAPHGALVAKKSKTGGRNSDGRITTRHKGGGHKQRYRIIDFKRDKDGVPGTVERIEYDPNRTAHIALIKYADGERRYIIAPAGLKVGAEIRSGLEAPITVGNAMPLRSIPVGSTIHCIEMKIGKGAQLARSAGASAQLVAREGDYRHCGCAPARCVRCIRSAAPPWAPQATPNTTCASWVKPAQAAGVA